MAFFLGQKTPTLGSAASKDVPASGNASSTQVVMGNDTRLSDARPASDVYEWAKASSKPSYSKSEVGLGNVPNVSTNDQEPTFESASSRTNITSGDKLSVLLGKIAKFFTDLKTVAFSGDYTDLSNKPTSLPASDVYSWAKASTKPSYAYSEITGTPTLGTAAAKDAPTSGDAGSSEVVLGNDSRLSDSRTPTSHTQAASTISAGTLGGRVQANATAAATLGNAQVRDITISDTDNITAGTTPLASGAVYIVYS